MRWLVYTLFFLFPLVIAAQSGSKGQFSGSFDINGNQFLEDSLIGATGTPQYDANAFGFDSWLSMNYRISGYEFGVRLEGFYNSNLLNPNDAYSAWGLGRIYAKKSWDKVEVTVGHIYDQIGSGIIYRSYEERALMLDNSIFGAQVQYNLGDKLSFMLIGGKQRFVGTDPTNALHFYGINNYDSWLYGGKIEGLFMSKEPGKWSITPGVGLMTKQLSDDQVDQLENVLKTYTPEDEIERIPYYTYAFSVYNTLRAGPFTWFVETAFKTEEVFYDQFASRTIWTGETTEGKFISAPGYVFYNALNYANKGLGASFEFKATKNFSFRADPFATLNRGLVNYLPPMARVNTFRLTARYAPATQDLGELAGQLDLTYRFDRKKSVVANYSHINDMSGTALYREFYTHFQLKQPRKSTMTIGLQMQRYNQEVYEGKPGVEMVKTITPFIDYLWIFNRKHSLRIESQYMHTKQDFGSWFFMLAEFSIAPNWIFEVSDMWNVVPYKDSNGKQKNDPLHYPTFGVTYSIGAQRFTVRYVKQVEGVVCSGGICRLEPAFSGIKLQAALQF